VIVGGGYIGLEMVEALRFQGLEVTILQRSSQIMGSIDQDMAAILQDYLKVQGVVVHTGVAVGEIYEDTGVRGVRTPQGDFPCDLVIVAAGVQLNSRLAREAGIAVGAKGAILVNRRMETNIPDIYAAGDCSVAWHELYQDNVYVPLGTKAGEDSRGKRC